MKTLLILLLFTMTAYAWPGNGNGNSNGNGYGHENHDEDDDNGGGNDGWNDDEPADPETPNKHKAVLWLGALALGLSLTHKNKRNDQTIKI